MLVNLNEVLQDAKQKQYAVGLFNTTDTDLLEGVISAAEALSSPVIIGTAEVLLPYGELRLISPSLRAAAERARVPVVLHYDHGLTVERCREAMDLGYSSIMFDGSAGNVEENLRATAAMVREAHARGITVEGEIGHVGQAANGDGEVTDRYTTPTEAIDFVNATGVDALAIAIGTAHGAYRSKPCLDIARLREIHAAVGTPLVLHGGSGLSDEDFRNTVQNGIAKINIFTDLCVAGCNAMKEHLAEDYLSIRNAKVEAVRNAVMKKMRLFGSEGRA